MSKTVFKNCNLFVGTKDELLHKVWFVVDEETGKLLKVGTGTNPKEDKNVDLHGQYVMSGLINAHTHVGVVNVAKEHYPETETLVTYKALKDLKSGYVGALHILEAVV